MKNITVSRTDNQPLPVKGKPKLRSFHSVNEARAFLVTLRTVDSQGVDRGYYSIKRGTNRSRNAYHFPTVCVSDSIHFGG